MGVIIVNGKRIEVPDGQRVVIDSGTVIAGGSISVGGVTIIDGLKGIVEVRWEGDLANLRADCAVTVNGNVEGDVEAGNSATVKGGVTGDVRAGNSVTCGDVGGNCRAGNSINRR